MNITHFNSLINVLGHMDKLPAFISRSLGIVLLYAFTAMEPASAQNCLESTCRKAPVRERLTAIKLGTPHMRGIVGGFEQGAGLGGGMQLSSAGSIPSLDLRVTALTSTRVYRRFDLEGYIPNIGGSRNHVDLWFSYMDRESDFFGIGEESSADSKTDFIIEQRSYQGSLYRDFTARLQGGIYAQVTNAHTSGSPALLGKSKILSTGGFFEYDRRDDTSGLRRGVDLYVRAASNEGLNNGAWFTDYGWIEAEFDVRGYAPLGSPATSLAMRSKAEFKRTKGGSRIPLHDLAWLGGREHVRGYHMYRFRGNNTLMFSAELRQTVYSTSVTRGADVFGFMDTGRLWDAEDFGSSVWRTGVGGGLQYRHSNSLAARIEAGRSNEGVQIYLSLSRGF